MPVNTAFFSVIIPTYNRASVLKNAIASVLDQKFTDIEIIVVNDGSTDNTKEIISTITDKRIKYIYQENKERSAARNLGIEHAQGKYICFLDSDDEYMPGYLSALHDLLQQENFPVVLIKSYAIINNAEGKAKRTFVPINKKHPIEYVFEDTFFLPCIAVHAKILKNEKFDVSLSLAEDTDLWVRILSKFNLLVLEEHVAIINVNSSEIDPKRSERLNENYIHSFHKILDYLRSKHLPGIKETKERIVSRTIWLAKAQFDQKKYFTAWLSVLRVYWYSPKFIFNFYFIKWLIKKKR